MVIDTIAQDVCHYGRVKSRLSGNPRDTGNTIPAGLPTPPGYRPAGDCFPELGEYQCPILKDFILWLLSTDKQLWENKDYCLGNRERFVFACKAIQK